MAHLLHHLHHLVDEGAAAGRLQVGVDDALETLDVGPHLGDLQPAGLDGREQLQIVGLVIGEVLLVGERGSDDLVVLVGQRDLLKDPCKERAGVSMGMILNICRFKPT